MVAGQAAAQYSVQNGAQNGGMGPGSSHEGYVVSEKQLEALVERVHEKSKNGSLPNVDVVPDAVPKQNANQDT
eukprot:8243556-Karenia_brevis.AAC.1